MSRKYTEANKTAIAKYRAKNPEKVKGWTTKSNAKNILKLQDEEYYKMYLKRNLSNRYDALYCVRYLFKPFINKNNNDFI
jgi:hypothetical protein